ncbi:hypothetical protein [Virgibacillus sp. SK37]|uniref:WDGH domain-containing protein n=1 Tax=Virgibacillus sp. SK37 TaxID=403957 RepID=UPI000ACD8EA0|nr:hypothetical protein [Virgibacillus sp. SK37]
MSKYTRLELAQQVDYLTDVFIQQFCVRDEGKETIKMRDEIIKLIYPEWFNLDNGEISDGYHTFNELYHHRMILFSVICNQNEDKAWKSKLHADGTMYEDYFIVGITTEEGNYTYHYHLDNWNYFKVKELEYAPEWDGHKPEDITRLLSLGEGGR